MAATAACHERLARPPISCDPHNITVTAPCNCTIMVYLHLRKCGGTAIRSLFQNKALVQTGWAFPRSAVTLDTVLKEWGGSSDQEGGARDDRLGPISDSRRWYIEIHASPGLRTFVQQVEALRSLAAVRGCQVISATMLRNPASMAKSEFNYFRNEDDKIGLSLDEWMRMKPELLLLGSGVEDGLRSGFQRSEYNAPGTYKYLFLPPRTRHDLPQTRGVRQAREAFDAAWERFRTVSKNAPRAQQMQQQLIGPSSAPAQGGGVRKMQRAAMLRDLGASPRGYMRPRPCALSGSAS